MEFSRNRFTKWLLIIAGIFLVVGAGVYIYRAKFSADSVVKDGQIDTKTLENLAAAQNPDLPTIKLNFSKSQIETAFAEYRNTNLIDLNKLNETTKQVYAELSAGRKSSQTLDGSQLFLVLDKDGSVVNQTAGLITKTETAKKHISAADNFDFSADIPQGTKDNLIASYSKIENLYGFRSNSNKIKIVKTGSEGCVYGRSCFDPASNSIKLTPAALQSNDTQVHELVHAFHGPDCLAPIWEEGMATSVTAIILNSFGMVNGGLAEYELDNLPYLSFVRTNSPQGNEPYLWGSAAMYKIYLENNDFYKNFNKKLYESVAVNESTVYSDAILIRIVSQDIAKIEGETTLDWFSHQYGFVRPDYNGTPDDEVVAWASYNFKMGRVEFHVGNEKSYQSVNLKSYYSDGSLAGECSGDYSDPNFLSVSNDFSTINSNYCKNVKFISNFTGYFKNIVTTDGNLENKRVSYSALYFGDEEPNVTGVINGKADSVKVTNIDTGRSTTSAVSNGLFILADQNARAAGRYKVEVIVAGKTLKNRWFNKSENGYTVFIDMSPEVNAKIAAKALGRSISLDLSANIYEGKTYRINGIPVFRSWGQSEKYTFAGLKKNTLYNWSVLVNTNSNYGKIYGGKIRTLKGPDFKLVNVKNSGNVVDSTFSRQYIFNSAYDPKSVSLSLLMNVDERGGGLEVPFEIVKINEKSFKLVPTDKLKNNAAYGVVGLSDILDIYGNPIYQFDWQYGSFFTPVNPADAALPVYNMSSNVLLPSDKIIISTNFQSKDLVKKLESIKLASIDSSGNCEADGCLRALDFTAVAIDKHVVAGPASTVTLQIVITPKKPMISGENYFAIMPVAEDDNNNLVTTSSLNFTVN